MALIWSGENEAFAKSFILSFRSQDLGLCGENKQPVCDLFPLFSGTTEQILWRIIVWRSQRRCAETGRPVSDTFRCRSSLTVQ